MANEDHAIVIGIQGYPELPPVLQGPENDAKEFYEWVTTIGGVARTKEYARLILTSDFQPPATAAINAQPTTQALLSEFDRLESLGEQNQGRVGRRLYLYLSGHGFGQDLYTAALLMANATQRRTRYHIPGRQWADYFYTLGLFDEVLLFMDCCRERYATATLNGPGTNPAAVAAGTRRRFYGFGAKHGRLAVERVIDGRMRGVFTTTLLRALGGGASEEDGRITGESLEGYLYENMKELLSPADRDNPDVADEPDLYCEPPAEAFVIATIAPVKHEVKIPLPPASQGKQVQLLGERGGQKFALIASTVAAGPEWTLQLFRGSYALVANGSTQVVTIKGTGAIDVRNA
jgi:hypothetical protein